MKMPVLQFPEKLFRKPSMQLRIFLNDAAKESLGRIGEFLRQAGIEPHLVAQATSRVQNPARNDRDGIWTR